MRNLMILRPFKSTQTHGPSTPLNRNTPNSQIKLAYEVISLHDPFKQHDRLDCPDRPRGHLPPIKLVSVISQPEFLISTWDDQILLSQAETL